MKSSQDKGRAELRNQLDALKNEHARAKSDWEREKKRLLSDFDATLERLKRD